MNESGQKRVVRLLGWSLSASLLVLAAAPNEAFAHDQDQEEDEYDSNGGAFFIDFLGGRGRAGDRPLHIAAAMTEPDPLRDKNLKMDGPSQYYGGGFHILLMGKHARGGMGLAFFGMEGVRLKHDALTPGLSVSAGTQFGANFDVFIGRELVRGPVFPYVDLMTSFSVMQTGVVLKHETLGVLGETAYNAYTLGAGPRVGIAVPFSDDFAINVSAYFGLFGAQQANLMMSIGYWDR